MADRYVISLILDDFRLSEGEDSNLEGEEVGEGRSMGEGGGVGGGGGKDISAGVGGNVLGLLDHFQQIRRSCMYPGRRRRVMGIIFSLQGESWFYHTC